MYITRAASLHALATLATLVLGCNPSDGHGIGVTTGNPTSQGTTTDPTSTAGPTTSTTGTSSTSAGTTSAGTTSAGTTSAGTTDTADGTTGGPQPACGDGVVDDGEACDDGDADNTDDCTDSCEPASCGDGHVHAGEEECDDGNDIGTDACLSTCVQASCGDGHVGPGEACDDGNQVDGDGCTKSCTVPGCGDGVVMPGEQCDDGNNLDTDACLGTCKPAVCGDGKVHVGVEECDDGDLADGDGCAADCTSELPGKIYLTSMLAEPTFYGYDIASDTWEKLPDPPDSPAAQLTNDGERVYLLGSEKIFSYDPLTKMWSDTGIPDTGVNKLGIGFFKWTTAGFYFMWDATKDLYHHKGGQWTKLPTLPQLGSCGGSWDPVAGELYIRTYGNLGFQVIRPTDDSLVRTIKDTTKTSENNRTGSYTLGFFYGQADQDNLIRFDAKTGAKFDTMQQPFTYLSASEADPVTGKVYIAGSDGNKTFQVYDPNTNKLTLRAQMPSAASLTTITLMIKP